MSRVSELEVLSERHCRDLLARRNLGRISFSVDGQPEIFPVNYAVDGSIVVLRTAEGTLLESAFMQKVAFEVDDWDPAAGIGWSVVVKGIAHEISEGLDPFSAAFRALPVFPLAPGKRERWIAIYPSGLTGRRFRLP